MERLLVAGGGRCEFETTGGGVLHTRHALAIALDDLARVLKASDRASALALRLESLEISRALADLFPADVPLQHYLAISLGKTATLLQHDAPAATPSIYSESLDVSPSGRSHFDALPDHAVELVLNSSIEEGDSPSALCLFKESLGILRDLAGRSPTDARAQREQTFAMVKVSELLTTSEPEQAEKLLGDALDIRRHLAEKAPTWRSLQDVGIAAALLANALPACDAQVAPLWSEAAANLRKSHTLFPDNRQLALQSWDSARQHVTKDPEDRHEWSAYISELESEYGFEAAD